MVLDTNTNYNKGDVMEWTVPCDGEIEMYAYDDNFFVGVNRVEDGAKYLLGGCDNELPDRSPANTYNFCYSSIPQHGAIICDRNGNQVAWLTAGEGLGCPGGKMDN